MRRGVRVHAPGVPVNGRAMTRDTPCSPLQHLPRRSARGVELGQRHRGLVRRHLEDAVGRGVDDPLPGAQVLRPELVEDRRAGGRPVAQHSPPRETGELGDDLSRESPAGRLGTAAATIRPQSSQCPVVLSLPGLVGSHTPYAARGRSVGATPAIGAQFPSPRAAEVGRFSAPTARATLPRVSLPVSP